MAAIRWTEERLLEYQKNKIKCDSCGALADRTGPTQKYCAKCSEKRDLERKRLWVRDHPQKRNIAREKERSSEMYARGAEISGSQRSNIAAFAHPKMKWLIRVAVPFSYAASKNHIYTMSRSGHVALSGGR